MEKLPQQKQQEEIIYYQEDEIDLYELWLALKKRWKIIAITTTVFILSSIFYIIISKPVYTSSFLIRIPNNISSPLEVKAIIENIETLRKEKRFTELEKTIGLPIKN